MDSDRRFDLDTPSTRCWLYQTVLREAARPSDLTDYLNRGILLSLWPGLRLPAGVRRAWEELHPVLRSSGSANRHPDDSLARTRHTGHTATDPTSSSLQKRCMGPPRTYARIAIRYCQTEDD
jgi:hypothetical protein